MKRKHVCCMIINLKEIIQTGSKARMHEITGEKELVKV